MPNVSIIVPCYKVEKYLDRCMNSLVNQTLKDIEIILVDDGSPDNVPLLCDKWATKDARIKVVHKQNAGLGYARNSGMEVAIGEYVAFVDSDDYVDVHMYESLYNTAIAHHCDVVFCGFWKESEKGVLKIQECKEYKEFSGNDVQDLIPNFIANAPGLRQEFVYEMSVWHSIYKNTIIQDNQLRFDSEREYASEDILFQIDYLKYANKVAFIPDVFYRYCYNGDSLTKGVSIEKFGKVIKLFYRLQEKTVDNKDNQYRIDRLFLGYTRTMIRRSFEAFPTVEQRMAFINGVVKEPILQEIRKEYKPSYLPMYARLFTWLLYHRLARWVYGYVMLTNLIRK